MDTPTKEENTLFVEILMLGAAIMLGMALYPYLEDKTGTEYADNGVIMRSLMTFCSGEAALYTEWLVFCAASAAAEAATKTWINTEIKEQTEKVKERRPGEPDEQKTIIKPGHKRGRPLGSKNSVKKEEREETTEEPIKKEGKQTITLD